MHYLVETGPHTVDIVEAEAPRLDDGHVRVTVAHVGVCHSDTARVAAARGPFPARIGHEVSGIVTESRSDDIEVGARVVAYVVDGYATELVVPRNRIVPLHPDCDLVDAALAEPLACVIGGVEMLDLAHVPHVVLVGAGFMGLLTLRLLVAGGHRVIVIEPRDAGRERATEWGAEVVLHPDDARAYFPDGAPVVIEATGAAAGLELAGDLTELEGTLGIMGFHQSGGGVRTVPMEGWNYKALRVLNLHHRDPENVMRWIDRAQRLSAHGVVRPSLLVDGRVTFDQLPAVFADPREYGAFKTVLDVD
ncbi:alcohol dehydrogenase [Herbiconiux sp. L3-i23]|nr:alcohol dehydrogenase [Herbiconiux sp. L3-i23]